MIQVKIEQVLINILFIMLAFTTQSCVFSLLPFLSTSPNLLLILTLSLGLVYGKNTGMFYGVLPGFLLDLLYNGLFGFYTLMHIYTGYANGIFTKHCYEDYIILPLILSIFNGIWYSIYIYVLRFLIRGRLNLPYYFKNIVLPEIISIVVTTSLIYRLFLPVDRRVEDIGKREDTKLI